MNVPHLPQNNQTNRLRHILFILDGNGRWASGQNFPREEGHVAGAKNITDIVYECINHNIKYISLFVFSSDNWKRPKKEVKRIFKALGDCLAQNLLDWHAHGVQLQHIGQLNRLDPVLQTLIRHSLALTRNNAVITMSIILDYGARNDIMLAMQHIIQEDIHVNDITEYIVSSHLSTANIPDPDLIIRTGGQLRISNIFLWELSYSELWFTSVLWPDFLPEHLREAINDYYARTRTFGNAPQAKMDNMSDDT